MSDRYVFDASAVLALLQSEPGASRAIKLLETGSCAISAVNLSEVASKLVLCGMSTDEVREVCEGLALEILPAAESHALVAAQLTPVCQPLGLSLRDRFCLAAAILQQATAVTTDRAWTKLHDPKVELLR